MRSKGAINRIMVSGTNAFRPKPFESADDAGCAEPALATPCSQQRVGPLLTICFRQTINRGDHPPSDTTNRGYTSNTRRAIDKHGATSTLTLRIASGFRSSVAKGTTKRRQQRDTGISNGDGNAINDQIHFRRRIRLGEVTHDPMVPRRPDLATTAQRRLPDPNAEKTTGSAGKGGSGRFLRGD